MDGGYIVAGGFGTCGLIKTDVNGNMLWDKIFDKSKEILSIQQTVDDGYIIAGDISGPDVWLAKTDANGNMLWDRTFGGSKIDWAQSVQQRSDGGYILAGYTVSHETSKGMVWLIKTDINGNMLWDKTFGETELDWAQSAQQTIDGDITQSAMREKAITSGTPGFGVILAIEALLCIFILWRKN
jgi:hypothetical protein